MYVGSLFSGIGGMEIGFEREGFRTKWFIENDEYCQGVLKRHWPDVPVYGDIREVDFNKLERVDILTGGFPCQDISCANPKGEGIEGERSGLWSYYKEAIRVLRPTYAVVENVPMLANRGLDVVLRDLAEIGYDAEWNIISAASVGAPHRRERIFIVAWNTEGDSGSKVGEVRERSPAKPGGVCADVAHPCGKGTRDTHREVNDEGRRESNYRSEMLRQRNREIEAGRLNTTSSDVGDPNKFNGHNGRYAPSPICGGGSEKTKLSGSEENVGDPASERLPQCETSGQPFAFFDAERANIQLREERERNRRGIWRIDPADLPDTGSLGCISRTPRYLEHNANKLTQRDPEQGEITERTRRRADYDWPTESGVGGVANGFPAELDGNKTDKRYNHTPRVAQGVENRVGRLRCLGNAVVPQVAQFIACRIKEKQSQ